MGIDELNDIHGQWDETEIEEANDSELSEELFQPGFVLLEKEERADDSDEEEQEA